MILEDIKTAFMIIGIIVTAGFFGYLAIAMARVSGYSRAKTTQVQKKEMIQQYIRDMEEYENGKL